MADDTAQNPGPDGSPRSVDELEKRLHALDAEMNALRRHIWMLEHGMVKSDDAERDLAQLRQKFRALGDEFTVVYREWNTSAEHNIEDDSVEWHDRKRDEGTG